MEFQKGVIPILKDGLLLKEGPILKDGFPLFFYGVGKYKTLS